MLALGGCAAGGARVTLSQDAVVGQLAYVAAPVVAAKRSFFGTDVPAPGDSAGGVAGGKTAVSFGTPDQVSLQGASPEVIRLTLSQLDDLGPALLTSRAVAAYQHVHASLPNGIGVLTDPMDIEIDAQSFGVEVLLGQRRALPGNLHLDYAFGLGVAQVIAAAHLQSALIDVTGHSHQIQRYGIAESRLGGAGGGAVQGSLILFESGARELRLGFSQSF